LGLLVAELCLNGVYFAVVDHLGKSDDAKHKCRDSVFHSFEAAFRKNFFEFKQNFEVGVLVTLVVYKVD
jgi:hypothetical protein